MGAKIRIFAYGSNMKTNRLRKRVPSAKPIGRARLFNKRLVFNKKSEDGSGKANLEDSPEDVVWGVLYEIESSDLEKLDKAEGGYRRTTMRVKTNEDKLVAAEVYISTEVVLEVIPFDWYKELLVCGAQEHQLPENYIDFLKKIPSKPNERRYRSQKNSP